MQISFRVPGKPTPKARPRLGRGGRVFTPKSTLDHELRVKVACSQAIPKGWPVDAEYEIICLFNYKNRRSLADVDNLVKLVCDALNPKRYRKKLVEKPTVWEDDVQVSRISAGRFVTGDDESTIVTIRVLGS